MFGLLPQYWLDAHGDGEVVLLSPPDTGCSNPQTGMEHVIACVPVHRVLLSSSSSYFSALLGPSWQQPGHKVSVKLMLDQPTELVPMVALLKCIYTGEVDVTIQDLHGTIVQPAANSTGGQGDCRCRMAPMDLLTGFLCNRQQLQLMVIKLADQFAVHGVMDVAVSNLTRLFSHQVRTGWSRPSLGKATCNSAAGCAIF
jgi:hypothetical protein